MKRSFSLLWIFILVVATTSCNAQTKEGGKVQERVSIEEVSVAYFHFTRRCVTCKAIESESLKLIESLYPDQYNAGKITLLSYNLDESESEITARKFNVSGQSLLVIKGENVKDLTKEGFMYARTNPAKFHAELEKAIGRL
jgi:hypothetical protein